jgi:glycosyltransferase involved in cell wall biosynthesis
LKKPLVSISVVTYNQESYIEECLDGILMQQTTFPFEIILGEDESSDGTRDICQAYAEKYPDKIKLFLRSRKDVIYINGNATGRFNMIENLKACTGRYIALCEGDDYWTDPLKLQKQVDFMEGNPEYTMVFTSGRTVYSEGGGDSHLIYTNSEHDIKASYSTFPLPKETSDIHTLAKGNYIHTPGVLFVNWIKEGIPPYMDNVTIGDWPLHLMTATKGLIKFIDEATFCYRVHSNGIYSKKNKMEKLKMALGQFYPVLNSKIFKKDVADIIEDYCLRVAFNYIKVCDTKEDYEYLLDTILAIDSPKLTKNITLQLIEKNVKLANQVKSLKPYKDFNLKRACKLFIKKYFKK